MLLPSFQINKNLSLGDFLACNMEATPGQGKLSINSPRFHFLISLVGMSRHTRETLTSTSLSSLLLHTAHSGGACWQVQRGPHSWVLLERGPMNLVNVMTSAMTDSSAA